MPYTVKASFEAFNKDIVNLDSEQAKTANSSRDWLIEKGCDLRCGLFYIHLLFLPFPPPHAVCCDKEPGKENEECTVF